MSATRIQERTLDDLDDMVHKRAEKLDRQFKSRRLKFLWSTPSLDETIKLVKGQRPGSVLSNFRLSRFCGTAGFQVRARQHT